MKAGRFFMYAVGIFCAMWYVWYIGGGPMRATKAKPFIAPNVSGGGGFNYSDVFK